MALLGLVVGMPAVVGLCMLGKIFLGGVWWPYVLLVAMVAWATVWAWAAFRVVRWPCPRCGRPWLANQEPRLGVERRCPHCDLGLYEEP